MNYMDRLQGFEKGVQALWSSCTAVARRKHSQDLYVRTLAEQWSAMPYELTVLESDRQRVTNPPAELYR